MSKYLFQTSRLLFRPFSLVDAPALYQLNEDPLVIQYTGDPPFDSLDAARKFVQNYNHYEQYGFGRWSVLLKENERFIGWCGLKYTPAKEEIDLGFRFFRKEWNKGYATESASAAINYGFEQLGLKKIVGRAMKANGASIRVLEKIGMRYEKGIDMEGNEGVQYCIF